MRFLETKRWIAMRHVRSSFWRLILMKGVCLFRKTVNDRLQILILILSVFKRIN